MPGLASAGPHTLGSLSISRTNGGSRNNRMFSPLRNEMIMDSIEPVRTGQYGNGFCQRENDLAGQLDPRVAEESLMLYCKPVELYNIIQRRALRNCIFLQRCLSYKIQVSQQKRIKMSVLIPKLVAFSNEHFSNTNVLSPLSSKDSELPDQFLLVFIMLTSFASTSGMSSAAFRLNNSKVMKVPLPKTPSAEGLGQASVAFILPELQKLILSARKDGDSIVFITNGIPVSASSGKSMMQMSSLVHANGLVFWGSISVLAICNTWNNQWHKALNGSGVIAEKVVSDCQLDLHPSRMLVEGSGEDRLLWFQPATNGMIGNCNVRLQVSVLGEEVGKSTVKDRFCDATLSAAHYSVPSHVRRFRAGLVRFFYYYYYNQRYRSEVTENFSCPFCLVSCGSFKGLSCHLKASHDLFNFEFLDTPERQVVNVSCHSDMLGPEGNVRDVDSLNDPRSKNFVYWSRSGRRRKRRGVTQIVQSVEENEKQTSEEPSAILMQPEEQDAVQALSENPSQCTISQANALVDGDHLVSEKRNSQYITEKINEQISAAMSKTLPETVSTPIFVSESETKANDMSHKGLLKKHEQVSATMSETVSTPIFVSELETEAKDMLNQGLSKNNEQTSATICETVSTHIFISELESEAKDKLHEGLSKKHDRIEEQDCTILEAASITTDALSPSLKKPRSEDSIKESMEKIPSIPNLEQMEALHTGLVVPAISNNGCLKEINCKLPVASVGTTVEKSKKISVERVEARNRLLLQKRQFYHSRTAQHMELEQLLSDKDSEDEIDYEVADIEDCRMLDDFVDVTKDEKEVMHLWNSFVRKQRVHADGHCPWACEAFAALHAKKFSKQAALRRCLMLLLIKLWNHHLIDGGVVNRSLNIVDSYKDNVLDDELLQLIGRSH